MLDAGLLTDAKDLDSLAYQRDSPDDAERIDVDQLVHRIRSHVSNILRANIQKTNRPVKNGPVSEYRSQVVGNFLKGSSASNLCQHCRGYIPALYRHAGTKIFINPLRKSQQVMMDAKGMDVERMFNSSSDKAFEEGNLEEATTSAAAVKGMKYLTAMHVHEHLRLLFRNEHSVLQAMFGSQLSFRQKNEKKVDHGIFFTKVIAVPPCKFRPPSVLGGEAFDNPQNSYLAAIIRLNQRILEIQSSINTLCKKDLDKLQKSSSASFEELIKAWVSLQEQVNFLFDSSRNTKIIGNVPPPGIKQILEKKEGLFRKHMMGKRVNFAARSVISPDPNLETSEIGVPMVFATRLTYPEPVTEYNVAELRAAVINGPDTHPGAVYVQMEDGTLANLESTSRTARIALANQLRTPSSANDSSVIGGKKVMRHIKSGDIVLMNRQPTLHKPSIMAHRVRVLPGEKTLRMHYANCNTYNADFDGDEMNMHFPQNELARAEAYGIAATDYQYLVPTDGSPLRGLIQDHIVSGVLLTLKDTWFTRETFQQLLWGALPEDGLQCVLTIPPAIVKPVPLWSGKQMITSILLNLTNNHAASLNLTSACKIGIKLWGPSHAEESKVILLDGYLCTGVMDKSQFGASAYGITHAVYELYGAQTAGTLLTCIGRLLTRYDQYAGFTCRMDDLLLNSHANERRRELISASHPIGRQVVADYTKCSSDNIDLVKSSLEKITRSEELSRGLDGAMKVKMNSVTSHIIEACLPDGQMKAFPLNNMSLMTNSGAKGSMVNFSQIAGLLGQQELEGRRVPVMVSGKTLPSFPAFDPRARAGGFITQRFLTGIRPQEFFFHCMAGREGLIDTAVKTSRSGYLQRCLIKHLESLKVHYDHTVRDSDGCILQFHYGEDGLDVTKQKYLFNYSFAARNLPLITAQCRPDVVLPRVNTVAAVKAARKAAKKPAKYEPVLTRYSPTVYLGAVSERFWLDLETFLSKNKSMVEDADKFRALMWLKYMKSLAEPGEAVGLLAAQSVGEPSTQMTLNTFHFAGFGAKNVTLGIPRLREIIMTASQRIKTPSVSIPLKNDSKLSAEEVAKRMSRLTLKQILRDITVEERLVASTDIGGPVAMNLGRRARIYSIAITFMPLEQCQDQFGVGKEEIQNALENGFIRVLLSAIDKILKRSRTSTDLISKGAFKETTVQKTLDDGESGGGAMKAPARDDSSDEENDDDDDHGGDKMEIDESVKQQLKKQAEQQNPDSSSDSDDQDSCFNDRIADNVDNDDDDSGASLVTAAKKESVLSQTRFIKNYRYDPRANAASMDFVYPATTPKLLLLDLLERHAADVLIRHIPGFSRVFPQDDPIGITTEGANLKALADHPLSTHLSLKHLYTNDIHAMLTTYGVEAARATIVKEIASVFGVYGISVDMRHLYLIADYMTVSGGYRPFNRMGMASAPSPLLQMTFETTLGFLRNAVLAGEWDELTSPSSRLVMGLPVELGTGAFQVRQNLSM